MKQRTNLDGFWQRLVGAGEEKLGQFADELLSNQHVTEALSSALRRAARIARLRYPLHMGADEKPYRVYRGGRTKGRVPLTRLEEGKRGKRRKDRDRSAPRRRRKLHLFRWFVLLLVLALALVVAWGVTSYLSFENGMSDANGRVPDGVVSQLQKQDGLLSSKPTTILVLGTDGSAIGGRQGDNRSDSIMLVHTEPDKHRFQYLSIPRDLQVEIPGVGTAKINAAFQNGGPALALRTGARIVDATESVLRALVRSGDLQSQDGAVRPA